MTSTNKKTTATTSPFFHTARELAAYLGVAPVTVRRLMRRKAIPYINRNSSRLGNTFDEEAVTQGRLAG